MPIKKGEEIFYDYRAIPRSNQLARYGYISEEYKPYDVIEIVTSKVEEAVSALCGISTENSCDEEDESGNLEEGLAPAGL